MDIEDISLFYDDILEVYRAKDKPNGLLFLFVDAAKRLNEENIRLQAQLEDAQTEAAHQTDMACQCDIMMGKLEDANAELLRRHDYDYILKRWQATAKKLAKLEQEK